MTPEMEELEVRGMMAATLRVLRMFGLAPLRFSRVDTGVYLVSTSRIILIIGIICVFGIQSLLLLVYYLYIMEYIPMLIQMHWITMTFVVLLLLNTIWTSLLLTVAIVGGVTRMKRLIVLLKQIQEVQTKLAYGCNTSCEPKTYMVVTILLLSLVINVFVYALDTYLLNYYSTWETFIIVLYISALSLIQVTFVILLELQYIFLGFNLYLVVKTINYQMREIILINKGTEIKTDAQNYKKLKNLFQCYLSICSTVSQMNQSEGLMMIFLISREIIHLFITTYNLSVVAVTESSLMQNLQILAHAIVLLHVIFRTVTLSEMGFRLQCEINKHKTLLTEMMWRQCDNVPLQRKLNNYVYHFLSKQPALSPLEIITLSRPLVATIVGAIISFMIIIWQFKLEELC